MQRGELERLPYCSLLVSKALQNEDLNPALRCKEGRVYKDGRCTTPGTSFRDERELEAYDDLRLGPREGNAFDDAFVRRRDRDERNMWSLPKWVTNEKNREAYDDWFCRVNEPCTMYYHDIGVHSRREHARRCEDSGGDVRKDAHGNPVCSELVLDDEVRGPPGGCRHWIDECMAN